jgi:hypothetical protein
MSTNTHLAEKPVEAHVLVKVQAWGEYRQVRHFPNLSLTSLPTTFLELARA